MATNMARVSSLNPSAFLDSTTISIYSNSAALAGSGNILVSPLSIVYATLLVFLGAKGPTRDNLDSSFNISKHFRNEDDLLQSFSSIISGLHIPRIAQNKPSSDTDQNEEMVIKLANGLFVEQTYDLKNDYLRKAVQSLNAAVEKKDFKNKDQAARLAINDWVAANTANRITDLIPAEAINNLTKLVLTNALYFKSPWATPFPRAKEGTFTQLTNERKKARFMTLEEEWMYHEDKERNLQYLEVPYSADSASFLIVLPRRVDGLRALESTLNAATFKQLQERTKRTFVKLRMPMFKNEFSLDYVDLLKRMGVSEAFTPEADFTGMSTKRELYVSKGFHKTFIEVNEKGTEAAAATAIVMPVPASLIRRPAPVEINADRPFMYAIRHNPTNAILFIGRLETV